MKVKLIFNAQFVGYYDSIVEIPDNSTDIEIKHIFKEEMKIPYDDNCSYIILEDESKN